MRAVAIVAVVVVALVAMIWTRPISTPSHELPQLSYIATAHQLGVVGYRDPAGAISPDGKYLAYAEGRFVRVVPVGGGAPVTLAPANGQIRYVGWRSNDTVFAQESGTGSPWWLYDVASTERRRLWGGAADLYSQLTWNYDGT